LGREMFINSDLGRAQKV